MHHGQPHNGYHSENISLRLLLLGFFAPVYARERKFAVKSEMMLDYAAIYMKRNLIAALFSFGIGEYLYIKEYALLGAMMSGMFILFSGLCSICLVALLEKNRKSRTNSE